MKQHTNYILIGLCFAAWWGPCGGRAATIWTGPPITFTKADGTDPTLPANQDRITTNVWIARGDCQGIYNAISETAYTHFLSPTNTAWATGTTANYSTLSYTNWEGWARSIGGPPAMPGVHAVLHLITDDVYIDITFNSWNNCHIVTSFPGFSYTRSTPILADQPPTVTITTPTNGASFEAPATVAITAAASDVDGNVTNVSFFDGTALLGQTNNTPYTVTATFDAGTHALTAVATDNAGLSATSSVVKISVGVTNAAFSVTITNPPYNSVFGNTDNILIGADVTDTQGSVTNVAFFDGAVLLRSLSTSPYSFSTVQFTFGLGLHSLTAVASDNIGAAATSAPVRFSIARYTPEVTNGLFSVFLLPVATNMSAPLYGISPPGDTHRLFVLEQNGLVRILQDGTLLPDPALDIQARVQPPLNATNANDERGLLGIAFHPGFNDSSSPGYQTLYTYNSEMIPTNLTPTYVCPNSATNNYMNVVNEWKISSTNANTIDPTSRRAVISFGKNAGNHNGGTITFGPDGYAYLALGDGGNANDIGPSHIVPEGNAQNLSTPLGKMLRFTDQSLA